LLLSTAPACDADYYIAMGVCAVHTEGRTAWAYCAPQVDIRYRVHANCAPFQGPYVGPIVDAGNRSELTCPSGSTAGNPSLLVVP
jgi:hypothetical protein